MSDDESPNQKLYARAGRTMIIVDDPFPRSYLEALNQRADIVTLEGIGERMKEIAPLYEGRGPLAIVDSFSAFADALEPAWAREERIAARRRRLDMIAILAALARP